MADDEFYREKDPDARLDYEFDWSAYLLDGDTIESSTWTVPQVTDGIRVVNDAHTDTTTTVWLEGGTVPDKYRVTNHIVTTGTREDDRTLIIKCKEL